MGMVAAGAVMDRTKPELTIPLKCIHCRGPLETSQQEVKCPECGARWPVVGGIPRFYQEAAYWGEISRQEAEALLADAKHGSWRDSVRKLVPTEYLQNYYLDLQRASWLALLGLKPTAVALDIGCGYGAITHSLALSVGKVFAIEAVQERVEFTRERLRQEGIKNATLLQSAATALPFFENSFDLIVVNGILEWIGEWDLKGSPRDAQLRFLSSLQPLLKDDGALVIGIENRFGLAALRGGLDHSGKAYTSVVPRRIATMMLRHGKERGRYSFWTPNSNQEYRTYTYSHYGYRKLLREAGFGKVSPYLAKPGYNRPYHLIPFGSRSLLREFYSSIDNSTRPPTGKPLFGDNAQVLMGNAYASFTSEFVIIALKNAQSRSKLDFWLRETLSKSASAERGGFRTEEALLCSVGTHCFGHKSILRFSSPRTGLINAVVKFSSQNGPDMPGTLKSEFRNLGLVWRALSQNPEHAVGVPKPIDYLRDGENAYMIESYVQGKKIAQRISGQWYLRRLQQFRDDFGKLIKASVKLTNALQTLPHVFPIDPAWYGLPEEIARDASLTERVTHLRYFPHTGPNGKPSWIQHGDFVPVNLFFSEKTGRFEVIDWADLASGYPPLYDLFSLIIPAGAYACTQEKTAGFLWPQLMEASFSKIFIEKGEINSIFTDLLMEACAQFRLNPDLIPSLLVEFLLIRRNYDLVRDEGNPVQLYSNLLRTYLSHV